MTTRWRDVPGFEGVYQVSFDGMVRSLDRYEFIKNRWGSVTRRPQKGRILKPVKDQAGYLKVGLKRKNAITNKRIHTLVAEAFLLDKPKGADRVNHKDSNRWNNVVTNLEWSDASHNALHYFNQPHARHWSRHK